MAESFLKKYQNKSELNKFKFQIHRSDQIMIATYRKTSLSSPSSCSELDTGFGSSMWN